MSRGLTSTTNTALARQALVSYVLLDIAGFYYTDAPYDIAYFGNTYEAQGNFLGISETTENAETQVTSISITFTGLDSTTMLRFANSDIINKDVTVYRALWDQATEDLIYDSAGDGPLTIFKGKIAGYRVEDAQDTATLTVQVDSQFTDFEKINGRRTNLANFQREHPADFSMQFSHETLTDLKWGKT
jgi:hypothetical protein